MSFKYRFQMYKELHKNLPSIYADARKYADEIGITPEIKGKVGLTGAVSSCHALLSKEVSQAMDDASRKVIENKFLVEDIREIVKDVYGDEYDAAPVNTCEAALWVSFDCLFSPPMQGRGDSYRARYIAPYERHLHHQGSYGRPFPGRYKDLFADRGVTAGELGFNGKRLDHVDSVFVKMAGADYTNHGIKGHPAVLLGGHKCKETLESIEKTAERHADSLTGFTSLAYDTKGYGYGEKDANNTPLFQQGIAAIAKEYGVPYVVDNAWGTPFTGTDPRKIGADVVCYSMDKSAGAPTVGLIIGKEDALVPIRRALGYHSDRSGAGFSYGKAAFVANDPGKEALIGLIAALKVLKDNPTKMLKPVEQMAQICREEFKNLPARFVNDIDISVSQNSLAVEVNYERTWKNGQMGIPIFAIEDMYSGTNIFQAGMMQMGIIPTIAYDANIYISLGLGTLDEDGNLIEDVARKIVKAQVGLMNITCKYAGVI